MLKSLPFLFVLVATLPSVTPSCCAGRCVDPWGGDRAGAGGEGRGRDGVRRALASPKSADRDACEKITRACGLPWITAGGEDKRCPRRTLAGRPGDGGLSGGAVRRGRRFSLHGTEHVSGRIAGGNGAMHVCPRNTVSAELVSIWHGHRHAGHAAAATMGFWLW